MIDLIIFILIILTAFVAVIMTETATVYIKKRDWFSTLYWALEKEIITPDEFNKYIRYFIRDW